MEYLENNSTDSSIEPEYSNEGPAHQYSRAIDIHHVDFTAGEGEFEDGVTEDSLVISDDNNNRKDLTHNDSKLRSDSVNFPPQENQLLGASQKSSNLSTKECVMWREDASVPVTWKVKEFLTKTGKKLEQVQSPSGIFFPGRKAAVKWMRDQGDWSNEDIDLMQSKLKIRWTEDDPTIPSGWKTRTSQIKTNAGSTYVQWFLSPGGKSFRGRKSVLKHIQADPSRLDSEDIKKFKSVPPRNKKKFSAEYDWNVNDPTVPEGWKSTIIEFNSFGKIVKSVRFLSPDGRFCKTRVEAIKCLLEDGEVKVENLERMKLFYFYFAPYFFL